MPRVTQHRALSCLLDPLSHGRSREIVRFRGGGIDDPRHLEHAVRRESSESGVLPNYVRVWSDVHTGDLVLGHVALHPLDAGTELFQHRAGALRDALQIRARDGRGVRYLALDDVLWHRRSPVRWSSISGPSWPQRWCSRSSRSGSSWRTCRSGFPSTPTRGAPRAQTRRPVRTFG